MLTVSASEGSITLRTDENGVLAPKKESFYEFSQFRWALRSSHSLCSCSVSLDHRLRLKKSENSEKSNHMLKATGLPRSLCPPSKFKKISNTIFVLLGMPLLIGKAFTVGSRATKRMAVSNVCYCW